MDVTSDSSWAGIGLGVLEGRVLEQLVGLPATSARALSEAAGVSVAQTEQALRRLEERALAVRTGDRPERWVASPPRVSVGTLLARRRSELARAEELAEQIYAAYDAASGPRSAHLVELLTDESEVAARYTGLLRDSALEVLHLAKPPYVTAHGDPGDEPAVGAGVSLRSVYETGGFSDALSLETALRGTADGGELRLASHLPTKLVVVDRRAALLPARVDHPLTGTLIVHSPALVAALVSLFEMVWERAMPASLETRLERQAAERSTRVTPVDTRTREVLRLMATGMKDDTIARVLGISRRTVQKHVSAAGSALGARTRFQIALLATEQGWLGRGSAVPVPEPEPVPVPVPSE
ncbi:LuxR C-terminal-related transcriptional regulator [Streptomyces sp. NPDC001068]|uniref:helix-turn-helix transcriptional regulator n=1 Tax=Streptomyces sp. NPDC001068 TaxID=3364544 RepID=UPI003692B558